MNFGLIEKLKTFDEIKDNLKQRQEKVTKLLKQLKLKDDELLNIKEQVDIANQDKDKLLFRQGYQNYDNNIFHDKQTKMLFSYKVIDLSREHDIGLKFH